VAYGSETYKLNLIDYYYKLDSYTKNLIGRSFQFAESNMQLAVIPRNPSSQMLPMNAPIGHSCSIIET
jgi:hypothetical protein